jgi:hypothetical protein
MLVALAGQVKLTIFTQDDPSLEESCASKWAVEPSH